MIHTNRSMNNKKNKKLRRIYELNDKSYLFIKFNFILFNLLQQNLEKKCFFLSVLPVYYRNKKIIYLVLNI